MVSITNSEYEIERAKIIIDSENEDNDIKKKYDMRMENKDGQNVLVGNNLKEGLTLVTKNKNDRNNKLKELEVKFQKLNLNKSKENKKMSEEDTNAIIDRKDMVKNIQKLLQSQEEQQKKIDNACTGIDCIKKDLEKFQHNHNASGTKFESKFSGLETLLNKENEKTCTGIDCVKNQLNDIGSKINVYKCTDPSCRKLGIREGDSFCPHCGREVVWSEDTST